MAVMTYTRRHVVDMLPEFLTQRASGFGPDREALLKELGISSDALLAVNVGLLFEQDGVIKLDRYSWRSPYALKPPLAVTAWKAAVDAGIAEEIEGGWRVSARGLEMGRANRRRLRDVMRRQSLPADAVRSAADALGPIADRIPAGAARAGLARRLRPGDDEMKADIVRLNRAVEELWYFRDDCHIGAWQDAGYEGPVFDLLSFIWQGRADMQWTKQSGSGATSFEGLVDALKQRQDRADVERAIATLEKRGDVARDGDSVRLTPNGQKTRDEIEEETDRRFFAIWQLDDAASARLGEDLRAVIEAFPKPG